MHIESVKKQANMIGLILVGVLFTALSPIEATATEDLASNLESDDLEEGRLTKSFRLLRESFFSMDDDVKDLLFYPVEHPKWAYAFLGAVGSLVAFDKPITRYYQNKIEPIFKGYSLKTPRFSKNTGFSGSDAYLTSGVAGAYLLGVAFNNEGAQRAALLATKASAYSVLISHLLLKPLFGRSRPVPNLDSVLGNNGPYTTNPYAFGHYHLPHLGAFQSGTGMPSFHFTLYFSVARVYANVYHNNWLPYIAAGALLTSNIRGHRHWVGDMVAGAMIGTAIGDVVSKNGFLGKSSIVTFIPLISSDAVSLNLFYRL